MENFPHRISAMNKLAASPVPKTLVRLEKFQCGAIEQVLVEIWVGQTFYVDDANEASS
jgi:hypothetical protein